MAGENRTSTWWRPHWSAVAAALLVVAAIGYANLLGKSDSQEWRHGWPNIYLVRAQYEADSQESETLQVYLDWRSFVYGTSRWPFDEARVVSYQPADLAANVGLAALLSCGAAYTLQRWSAGPRFPLHFNVKFLLVLVCWIAGLLMLLGLNTATWTGWQNWGYRAAVDIALAATGLTSYAVVDLVVVALGLAFRQSQEPSAS